MPLLTANLDPNYVSVCNNAAWAAGEMAVKIGGDEMQEFIPLLVKPLVEIINRANSPRTLLENTGITLGRCLLLFTSDKKCDRCRLGLVRPALVAPALSLFARPWCISLRLVFDINK